MDISEGYRMQVQEFEGQKYIAIRKFYRHGSSSSLKPGVPGFNLNAHHWEQLKKLKRSLVKAALANETKVVKLGYDKFIEVKAGIIWLKRLPEDCCDEFMKRNAVPLSPSLWKKLWQHAQWVDSQLAAPLSSAKLKYELETSSSDEEEEEKSKLAIDSGAEGGDEGHPSVKTEPEDTAPAASTPELAAGWPQLKPFPQEDTKLEEDPDWYRLRVQAAAESNARKRQLPSFSLRRQEAMKLPRLNLDE